MTRDGINSRWRKHDTRMSNNSLFHESAAFEFSAIRGGWSIPLAGGLTGLKWPEKPKFGGFSYPVPSATAV